MDEYLQYLYNYILETRRADTLQKNLEYQALRKQMLQAWEAMAAALTGEQREMVENLISIKAQISARKSEWLFLEGVSLGKWIARA